MVNELKWKVGWGAEQSIEKKWTSSMPCKVVKLWSQWNDKIAHICKHIEVNRIEKLWRGKTVKARYNSKEMSTVCEKRKMWSCKIRVQLWNIVNKAHYQ